MVPWSGASVLGPSRQVSPSSPVSKQGHLGNLGARAPPPSKGVPSRECWAHRLLGKTSEKTGLVQRDKWVFVPGTGMQLRVSLEPSLVPWAAPKFRPRAEGPLWLGSEGRGREKLPVSWGSFQGIMDGVGLMRGPVTSPSPLPGPGIPKSHCSGSAVRRLCPALDSCFRVCDVRGKVFVVTQEAPSHLALSEGLRQHRQECAPYPSLLRLAFISPFVSLTPHSFHFCSGLFILCSFSLSLSPVLSRLCLLRSSPPLGAGPPSPCCD